MTYDYIFHIFSILLILLFSVFFTCYIVMTYIIYTIDDCIYCDKAKELLKTENKIIINCSEILKNKIERDEFISKINKQVGYNLIQDTIYFPIIFNDDKFIGGFDELKLHIIIKDYYVFELDCEF